MDTEQPENPQTDFQNASELEQYKLKYDALLLESEQDFHDPNIMDFYVLSKTFLKEWNEFIGYESSNPDLKNRPRDFNTDLLEPLHEMKKYRKLSTQIILKKGLQNKIDYEIVNKKLMDFFAKDFTGIKIQRNAYMQADGHKFVEVYLKEMNAVFISHSLLIDIDRNQKNELIVDKLQCSSQTTIQEFKDYLLKLLNKNSYSQENIRLWKINDEIIHFFKETKRICNAIKSFDYEIPIKGIFLEKNLEVKLEDFGFSDTDIIIIEQREGHENWNFVQEGIPTMKKCGFCSKFNETIIFCGCKKVLFFNNNVKINKISYLLGWLLLKRMQIQG